ncbi:MAG TPA: FAD-binding oxidoreductase, partial [Dehalococcoidia bacterium]
DLRAFVAAVRTSDPTIQIQTDDLCGSAIDGMLPSVRVAPDNVQQLQMILREAQNHGHAVIPWGGGAHIAAGNVPAKYDIALSLAGMRRIVAYEPADLTVTVEAGITLAMLRETLGTQGQFLPLDPPGGEAATVGGALASNVQGALRHAFGTARDWLIGLTVVQPDGTVVRSGGRVVKNVAGYDMSKLYVGSLGTLGVIAEATFKLAPLPTAETTLALSCDSPHAAAMLIFAAHDAGLALHAAELLSPPAAYAITGGRRWTALMRAAGGARAVERTLREVREIAAGLQARVTTPDADAVWEAWHDAFRLAELSLHVRVLPSAVADVAEELDAVVPDAAISSTVSAGLVRMRWGTPDDGVARAAVASAQAVTGRHDGSMVIDAASPALKHEIDVFGPTRGDFAIMRRLKDELDPKRTLAPGRFAGRL